MRLCTVHGLTKHRNIVEPYTMLSNKRRDTYVEMSTEVRQKHNALSHSLMTGFESIMLSALKQTHPGIPQVGLLFRLSKNFFKRVISAFDYNRPTLRIYNSEVIFA